MEVKLNDAIDNLYFIFKKYKLKGNLRSRSCDCCVNDDEILAISRKPLKELKGKDLAEFMRSAMTTFGDIEDYKHFLPRILELLKDPKSDFLFDFICYEKLNYSEWETWPEEEQKAIEDYFKIAWYSIINDENSTDDQIEGFFEIVLQYGCLDLALSAWSRSKTYKSLTFIIEGVLNGFNFKLNDSKYNRIIGWLSSEVMLSKIEDLFFKTEDKEQSKMIAIGHTILENKYRITFN